MSEEDVVHVYDRILLSHKKKWNNDIWSDVVDLESVTLSEISQTEQEKYHMIPLIYEIWKEMI